MTNKDFLVLLNILSLDKCVAFDNQDTVLRMAENEGLLEWVRHILHLDNDGNDSSFSINRSITETQLRSCSELFCLLKNSGIPYAVLKGAYLATVAYGDYGFRRSCDIDFLIAREHISIVKDICYKLGFVEGKVDPITNQILLYSREQILAFKMNTHQIATMVKRQNAYGESIAVTVDINHSLTWGGYNESSICVSDILNQTKEIQSLYGFTYYVLKTEAFLLQLCLHTYKEAKGLIYITHKNGLSLRSFYDIYLFIKAVSSSLQIERFMHMVRKYKLEKYIAFVFYYVNQLFNHDDTVDKILKLLPYDAKDINEYGLQNETKYSWCNVSIYERFYSDKAIEHVCQRLSVADKLRLENIRKKYY